MVWKESSRSSGVKLQGEDFDFELIRLLSSLQEDDGLRKRKVTSVAASHSSGMATSAVRDEGLSTRVLAICVLLFVIGVIIGKLAL